MTAPTLASSASTATTTVLSVHGLSAHSAEDTLAIEEPLAIRITHGPAHNRRTRDLAVTMRTPGADHDLVAGFLLTEALITDSEDIDSIAAAETLNTIHVELAPQVTLKLSTLERNFYTTSSCGICGKASLLALQTVSPPRRANDLRIDAANLYQLPARLRSAQSVFDATGGLHAAGLFTPQGDLLSLREDVGRHNAVDKLIGHELLADRLPLRNNILLLSGRASFELLQKAVMAGIPMVASVGAPSSLAVQTARDHNITLAGFLRNDHFNLYTNPTHITSLTT